MSFNTTLPTESGLDGSQNAQATTSNDVLKNLLMNADALGFLQSDDEKEEQDIPDEDAQPEGEKSEKNEGDDVDVLGDEDEEAMEVNYDDAANSDDEQKEEQDMEVDEESDVELETKKHPVFFRFNPCFNGGTFGNGETELFNIDQLDQEDEDDEQLGQEDKTDRAVEECDVDYISKVFEAYYSLYKIDNGKHFNSNDGLQYGVVNKQEIKEKLALVDMSFEQISTELDYYLGLKIASQDKDNTLIFRLQEFNNVLNCLKTFQFINFDEYLGSEFFTRLHEFVNKIDGQPSMATIVNFLEDDSKLGDTESFYKLVIQLLLRGLFEQAINLLETWREKTKSQYISDKSHFDSVVQLLQNYPYDNQEHFREWKEYVADLANILENSDDDKNSEWFKKMVYCINGSKDVISSVSTKWYEILSGLFHFYIPTIKLLPEYLSISLEKFTSDGKDDLSICEENLIYILENRIVNVLPYLESLHAPTSAFISALCECRGLLPIISTYSERTERTISSYMLYQLGLSLVTPTLNISDNLLKRLYSLSFGILKVSDYEPYVRETISELLLRYPIVTNEDMEYCLTVAAKWKLPTTISIIYQRLGMDLIHKSWLEAMIFFSKSMEFSNSETSNVVGESKLIYYSLLLIEYALVENNVVDNDLINQVMENSDQYNELPNPLRQALAPYRVLYRVFQLIKESEKEGIDNNLEILELANELLSFQYLKEYQKILILFKILYPILQDVLSEEKKLNTSILVKIMENVNCLQNLLELNAIKAANISTADTKTTVGTWNNDYKKVNEVSKEIIGESFESDTQVFLKHLNKKLNQLFCKSII